MHLGVELGRLNADEYIGTLSSALGRCKADACSSLRTTSVLGEAMQMAEFKPNLPMAR